MQPITNITVEKAKTCTRVRVWGFSYVNVYNLLQVLDLRYIKLLLKRQTLVPEVQKIILLCGGPVITSSLISIIFPPRFFSIFDIFPKK